MGREIFDFPYQPLRLRNKSSGSNLFLLNKSNNHKITQNLIKEPGFSQNISPSEERQKGLSKSLGHFWFDFPANKTTMAEFRHIVRILNTDLKGEKKTVDALRKLHGVSFMYANAVCVLSGVPKYGRAGELSDADIQKLEKTIKNPVGLPTWLMNRRKDYETGEDKHVLVTDLDIVKDNDIKRLKKVKAYRGIRHIHGQPSRGQRTKSNFRKNKGKHKK